MQLSFVDVVIALRLSRRVAAGASPPPLLHAPPLMVHALLLLELAPPPLEPRRRRRCTHRRRWSRVALILDSSSACGSRACRIYGAGFSLDVQLGLLDSRGLQSAQDLSSLFLATSIQLSSDRIAILPRQSRRAPVEVLTLP